MHGNDTTYHFTGIPGSLAIFPTFGSTPGKDKFHQARVKVSLAHAIPANIPEMWGTVHLKCFDPPVSNVGALPLGVTTLKFTQADSSSKTIIATFSEGFGDNVIAAAHPNSACLHAFHFNSTDGKTLLKPGTQTAIPTTMRTDILYNAAWNGFKVPNTWVFNQSAYSIATETLDTIASTRGDSYAKSILKHDRGFEMEMKYDFDRTRGVNPPNNFGYVVAPASSQAVEVKDPTKKPPVVTREYKRKLSYVANSGVKFGGQGGAKDFLEISILDVEKMFEIMSSTIQNLGNPQVFNNNPLVFISATNDKLHVKLPQWLAVPNPPSGFTHFLDEYLNTLMHGVGYGKEYGKMQDYISNTNNTAPLTWQRYYQTLLNNKGRSHGSNTMTIKLVSTVLTVNLNGSQSYKDTAYVLSGDGHLYLQSHWGERGYIQGDYFQVSLCFCKIGVWTGEG